MSNIFPELDKEQWNEARAGAAAHGQQGLVRALELTTIGIANAGSKVSTMIGYLKDKIDALNKNLKEFNDSSGELTKSALNLTKWIMIATIVSSVATVIIAIDVVVRWLGR